MKSEWYPRLKFILAIRRTRFTITISLDQWFSNFLVSLPLGNAMIGHHYPLIPFPFSYVKLKEKILGCLVLVYFICKKIILL